MIIFISTITNYSFQFFPHYLSSLVNINQVLDNKYSEKFNNDIAIATSLCTDKGCIIVADDVVTTIHTAAIDLIVPSHQDDYSAAEQIINPIPIYT